MKRDVYKYFSKVLFNNLKNNCFKMNKETIFNYIILFESIADSELQLNHESLKEVNEDFILYYNSLKKDFINYYGSNLNVDMEYEFSEYREIFDLNTML